jgi:hypothetical protein
MPDPLDYATPAPRRFRPLLWVFLGIAVFLLIGTFLGTSMTYRAVRATQAQRVAAQAAQVASARAGLFAPTTPSKITLVQRQRAELTGTSGTVFVQIGDITGGQTLLTVSELGDGVLLPTVSVQEGDVQTFSTGGRTFELELVELRNFLTGDDFAVFELRAAGSGLSEEEKITRLIALVAASDGVTFVRNGDEHTAKDAAEHLKRKLDAAGGKVTTAQQFIEEIASRSSISGEPYRIKLPDGREQSSQQWLTGKLRDIEGPAPKSSTGGGRER